MPYSTKQLKVFVSLICLVFLLIFQSSLFAAATGKIAGQVVDAETNEPLVGANIVIDGTTMGAATDADGFYFILNIPPDLYTVKAVMIGYATLVKENVRVSVNRTTTLNFDMGEETLEGEIVTVEAERPVIQMDVSSSQKIVTQEVIMERPLDNLEEILSIETGISLQANTEGTGILVRGGNLNETDIQVDGISTRNRRNQQPITNLNLTAIKEIEILTGGFNAEYSDVRSGMVNVLTREGSLHKFSFNSDARISPPARKHFGPSPYSVDGPFWQVYAGPDAFTGVTDEMVKEGKYPFEFVGWNEVARQFLSDPDPSNDMTPQELLEVWKWQHRLREYADKPDYIVDASLSGPIPGTPVAFMVAQRYENLQLAYPFSRNNSISSSSLLKLTTHLSPQMKLSVNNNLIFLRGVSGSIYDNTNGIITGTREGTEYARDAFFWRYIWHDANYNPIETTQYSGGLLFNHVLNSKTYYDLRLEYTNYQTTQEPIALRDTTGIKKIGNRWYDEAPFGYYGSQYGSITEKYDILGDFLMSGGGRGQDHSRYWGVSFAADLVTQLNNHNQVKTGISFDYTDYTERREINHTATTLPREEAPWYWWYYNESPVKLGAYIQDKLEYKGMIANVGVRVDYMKYGRSPYDLNPDFIFEDTPYTLQSWRANNNSFSEFQLSENSYQLYWSPRLGISHPVTSTSKIFFNYGHFYQPPITERLYTIQPSGNSTIMPNLQVEWPRTISYELGIEKSLASSFLIHFMGYYKDVSNEIKEQNIVTFNEELIVRTFNNNTYADIRGLELRLEKRTGRWWYGWVSLEYMVKSIGRTGLANIYENRQRAIEEREIPRQERGWPVPSVNAYLTFQSPRSYGPEFLGIKVLGNWRLNILQEWTDGGKVLLEQDARLLEQHWADVIDYHNTDILLEKRFDAGGKRFGLYMQVKNLFNYKGFPNPLFYNRYVDSLHFPWESGDQKGNDKLGDHKADHIDLGWNTWAQFVNPRDIFFGLRIQL